MQLTNQLIKNAKPDESKTQKFFDGGGLFLEITPAGSKRWRLKYRFECKEKLISLGIFPTISLKVARERRDDAKRQLAHGINPSAQRKAIKEAIASQETNCFEVVAQEWLAQQGADWAPSHIKTIKLRLKNDILPYIGKKPVGDITPTDLITILRRIEQREAFETAHRVRTNMGQVFRYAIATGRIASDPTRDLKGALRPVKTQHLAAITDPKRVSDLLRMIDGYSGSAIVSAALSLAPLVFVRPGELRTAIWNDIDFETGEWRYTVKKTNTPHIVPLRKQAIEILTTLHPITGNGHYVFPSSRTFERPMSDNAILAALRSLGIPKEEMCGHGFRAMARTILDEVLGFPPHLIEHQLAHSVKDSLGRAYNRIKYLPDRKEMMQTWADYLFCLKGKN